MDHGIGRAACAHFTLHWLSVAAACNATRIASIISPDRLFSFLGMFSVNVTTPSEDGGDVITRCAMVFYVAEIRSIVCRQHRQTVQWGSAQTRLSLRKKKKIEVSVMVLVKVSQPIGKRCRR